jgi:hypothetical protein
MRLNSKAVLLSMMTAVLLTQCSRIGDYPAVRGGRPVEAHCTAGSASHFPPEAFGAPRELELQVIRALTPYLAASESKRLWCGDQSETYRVLWIETNRPVRIATVWREEDQWRAAGILFDDPRLRNTSRPPETVATRLSSQPTVAQVDALLMAIGQANLWNAATWRHSRETDDGSLISLELRNAGSYRVITRYASADAGLEHAARILIQATGLPPHFE